MERRAGFGYQTVCLGFTLPTRGDGALTISDESVWRSRGTRVEGRGEERGRKTRPVEGEPRADTPSTKAQGGFMQSRGTRGERMTSQKYASAAVHYLR